METTTSQFAVIGRWSMDLTRQGEQDRELIETIVPMTRQHPAFVAGYWARDPESGRVHSVIIMDDEQAAHEHKELIQNDRQSQAEFGVVNEYLLVTNVVASAHADERATA